MFGYTVQSMVLTVLFCAISSVSGANAIRPSLVILKSDREPKVTIIDADLKGPFGFQQADSISRYDNYKVCAMVELLGDGKLTKHEVTQDGRKPKNEELLGFRVRIVSGTGAMTGKVYDCLTPRIKPSPSTINTNRYLLLGWMSKDKELEVSNQEPMFSSTQNSRKVKVDVDTIYVGSLIPTELKDIQTRGGPVPTAFTNMARAIVAGTDIASMRTVTSKWANARPDTLYSIGGVRIYSWLVGNIGPILRKRHLSTPAEQLRIGGLLADWLKPNGTMEYIKTLATVFGELRDKDWKTDRSCESLDKQFLRNLNLGYRMPSDEIFEIALSDSALYYLVLDPGLAKPSVETQRKMLVLLDDQDIYLRAGVYSRLANWYGKRDWALSSSAKNDPITGRDYIQNEAEMKTYWNEKLGGTIGP